MGFEDNMKLKSAAELAMEKADKDKEETQEDEASLRAQIAEAKSADEMMEIAQKLKNLEKNKSDTLDSVQEETSAENKEEKEETEKSTKELEGMELKDEEGKKVEDYIEANKEKIKNQAEKWVQEKEKQFEEEKKGFLDKFVNLGIVGGGSLAAAIELGLHAINNPYISRSEQWEAMPIILAVGAVGSIAGGAIGKLADYLERRKLKKQNKKI